MPAKQCVACGKFFKPWPQTPNQSICSKPECQRARGKRNKQNHRRKYPELVAAQNRDWATNNPDYWKHYRETHPDYVERNREQQKHCNHLRHQSAQNIASIDPLPPGRYLLTPVDHLGVAKRNSWLVEIRTLQVFPDAG